MTDVIQWILIAVSIPVIAVLARSAIKRARALSDRIDEYHDEQEAQKNSPGPVDPYQSMSEVFGGQQDPENGKSGQ